MSVLIKGMEMPKSCFECELCFCLPEECSYVRENYFYEEPRKLKGADGRMEDCPLVEIPKHGRLIDADALRKAMYHRAFETDGDTMWKSGCWVRYRAIEQVQDNMPTVIEGDTE